MKHLYSLLPYLKKFKKKIYSGFFFIILSNASDSLYPLVIGMAIDDLSKGTLRHNLLTYVLVGLLIVVLRGTFLFLTRQTLIVVSREIENDLRFDFFSHLQRLSKSFYNNRSTGDLMAHATNDISNVRNFVGPGIMYSFQTFTRILFTLIILFSMSSSVTLLALAPLPLITYIVYKVGKLTFNRSRKVYKIFSDLTSKAQECFSGIRVVKSYVRERNENREFDKISFDYQKKNLSLAKVQAFSFPMMFMLTSLSVIIVIYFGGIKIMEGSMSLGDLSAFLIYLGQLTWPMIAFGWIINLIQRAAPSMERLLSIINVKPDIADNENTDEDITQKDIEGEIEFENVSFKYPLSNNFVLKNINLKIRKGTTLGIIGHTGSGKSTLISLIPRIWDVTEGRILIDGMDIKKIPLDVLRRSVGIVPQESFLFSTTIEKNVSYSSDFIDEDEMISAAKKSGLYKDVDEFPLKFKTVLGERGITMSGGQKQRTSIARAIYKKPEILILDDSLSAVDTKTEEEILKELKSVMRDRTSLIISHRISTIKNANNIIVLSHSKIAEEGTHNELISAGGIYFDLYKKQLLEEEIKEF
ncbi:MAG TPA: ABC transporter ATP-binding protein [Ignavibacteria bacterium]|nr:ABC transporter ATP-binding protein [Ignavibacteria bacterium]HQY51063.1 ABC transporter ATP-binding protein [Ignavibacteria bacterium]HRB00450.1 ABC transporter ATP-binding protein [Ignavibacteria bacterium]